MAKMASAEDLDNVILDANSSRILKKLLACSACKAYPKGGVNFCNFGHNVCSLCHTEEDNLCPVDECPIGMLQSCTKTDFADMVRAMKLPVPCKNRHNGCTDQHIIEKIEEHESECGHRWITGRVPGIGYHLFKDFAAKVEIDYIKEQKWHFKNRVFGTYEFESKIPYMPRYAGAFKFFMGPDQHRFCVDIGVITDKDVPLRVCVVGGKEVAKKYKAELRLFSSEDISATYNGPVFPMDDPMPDLPNGKAFYMNPEWFKTFNHGYPYFGYHNMDKNGEIVISVLFKIIKKELDIPTDIVKDEETHE